MEKQHSRKGIIKHLFVPLILLSLFSFNGNIEAHGASAAPTIITTKSSDTYINNYYSSISPSLTGDSLASALETLLKAERNASFSYGSLQTSAFPYTDADPTRPNGGYIVSFYSGDAVIGYTGMNKEHTWPNSHGGNKVENDPHMVRPTLTSENSSRGNEYFSNTAAGWDPASLGDVTARGMAARIILYSAVIGKTSGLVLEDVGRGQGSGTGNKMGKLGDLLKWNLDYPVNAKEILRNETLDISLNYNRNPFIDRPEYGCAIWGNTNNNTKAICAAYATPSVTLDKTTASVNIGNTTKLTATVTNSSSSVSWSSSNTSIATVNSSGTVTGVAKGTATITASITEKSIQYTATCVISVKNPSDVDVTSVQLNKTNDSILVGETTSLTATVLPSNATINTIKWTTSNSAIASISSTTNKTITVTGVSKGTATITATTDDGGFQASCSVKVTSSGGTGEWTLVTDASTLSSGDELVIASNASGRTAGSLSGTFLTSASSTFSSDKSTITDLASDTTIFTLGGTTGSWTLTNSSGSLLGSSTVKSVTFSGGTTTWSIAIDSSDNATIQNTTSANGRILYNSSATRFTTYTSNTSTTMFLPQIYQLDGGGTPPSPTLSSISIASNPNKTSYLLGETLDLSGLKVKATYSDGSSDSNISGYTTSPAAGTALNTVGTQVITVNYQGKSTSFNVTVNAANVAMTGVSLNTTSATLDINGTLSLSATINPTNAYPVPSLNWSSSDSTVASVSASGLITALKAGSSTITVTATQNAITKTATCSITVNAAPFVPTTTYTEGGGVSTTATLTTDISTLAVGDKILIAASAENYVMSTTQNGNNRASVEATKSGNKITGVNSSTMQIITLEAGSVSNTFAFNVDSGYLYAASSNSNHLKTQSTKDANASFAITVSSGGVATATAQGTYTRNQLKFNTGNNPKLFSCYSSGQTDIAIYEMNAGDSGLNYDYLLDVLAGDYCEFNIEELDLINTRYEAMTSIEKFHFNSEEINGKDGKTYTGEEAYTAAMIRRSSLAALPLNNPFIDTFQQNEIVMIIVIISLIGVSVIGASLFVFKRKRNEN